VWDIADKIVDFVELVAIGYTIVLVRRRRPLTTTTAEPPESTNVDLAMKELLEKSRPSAGRVHIHDVEEVIRRRLG